MRAAALLAVALAAAGCGPLYARRQVAVAPLRLGLRVGARTPHPAGEAAAPAGGRRLVVTDAQCLDWLATRRRWTAAAATSGAASGGLGVVRAALPDSTATTVSFAALAVLTGGFAALAASLSGSYATDFGHYCTSAPPEPAADPEPEPAPAPSPSSPVASP